MAKKGRQAKAVASPQTTTTPLNNSNHRIAIGVCVIASLTLIIYLPALNGGFIWDDKWLITNNPLVKAANGPYRMWFTTQPMDYWPVTNTLFWLEWRSWGMNPLGYHLTNLLLHITNSLLIWLLLRRLSIPGAFFAALLFALHPVNVESVAWIAQLKNVLSMLFFLVALLWYLKAELPSGVSPRGPPLPQQSADRPGVNRWYWLSLLAFTLAMLSKGSAAILPLVLLLIVWWISSRITKWDLLRSAPFFFVAFLLTLVNIWFQSHGSDDVIRQATFGQRLLGAGAVVWFYLGKALLPINLVFVYPQWNIDAGNLRWWLPLLAALLLTVILISKRAQPIWRALLFAWGVFCVALIPVMGFTDAGFMRYSLVADHYQYIALVAVMALLSVCWSTLYRTALTNLAAAVGAVTLVCLFGYLAWLQNHLYANEITIYESTLQDNPDCWVLHSNLGIELSDSGDNPKAIAHFEKALQIKADYAEAHYNLGRSLQMLGKSQLAIEQFQEALRLKPNYADAENNWGITLKESGDLQQAVQHYQKAIELNPELALAHYNLAIAKVDLNQPEEAIQQYQQAVQLNPEFVEAFYNLAIELAKIGRTPQAIESYQRAIVLKPDHVRAHFELGKELVKMRRFQEAIEQFQQTIELLPNSPEAFEHLAKAYAEVGRSPDAIAAAENAITLARSQNKLTLATQIQAWLDAYRSAPSSSSR